MDYYIERIYNYEKIEHLNDLSKFNTFLKDICFNLRIIKDHSQYNKVFLQTFYKLQDLLTNTMISHIKIPYLVRFMLLIRYRMIKWCRN
jgi:hypothetical protein